MSAPLSKPAQRIQQAFQEQGFSFQVTDLPAFTEGTVTDIRQEQR